MNWRTKFSRWKTLHRLNKPLTYRELVGLRDLRGRICIRRHEIEDTTGDFELQLWLFEAENYLTEIYYGVEHKPLMIKEKG
jgi:hypothetical protein